MIEKLRTARWFLERPAFWRHGAELGIGKLRTNHDTPELALQARAWAADRAVTVAQALEVVRLLAPGAPIPRLATSLLEEGSRLAELSAVRMGGPGDLNLLYAAVQLSGARRIIETGVAYGWSSLAILAALEHSNGGRLVSVDMPYPKMNNESFVGIVVPERLRSMWEIVREPDRNGLKKAISRHGGAIDLCHYDSDKSWWGRQYGHRLLWAALAPGAVFISDDIQDNLAFAEFVETHGLVCAVTAFEGKYVGIARKP